MAGENVVLSAPTSFGKSAIIHGIIASKKFHNIVIVVPTLALIDETRRKMARHQGYRVITQNSQRKGERNIFVLTPERVNERGDLGDTDFFIVDEFYKLGTRFRSDDRSTTLNLAFYKLWKTGAQFYMLGPSIDAISAGFTDSFRCKFLRMNYTTVVTDVEKITVAASQREAALLELLAKVRGPTIIYCSSPNSANDLARRLVEERQEKQVDELTDLADWLGEQYHPDWSLVKALRRGIGIHHGRIPRALAQAQIRLFDAGLLDFIICTSTMIEGVNTAAKNVIIWDNTLNREELDFFTFSNIKGRTGRMFRHFVGRVYVFDEPPQHQADLEVDIPVHEQNNTTPLELLMQMDEEDLKEESVARVADIPDHPIVTLDFARRFKDIDPMALHALADELLGLTGPAWARLVWNRFPTKEQLQRVTELMWEHLPSGRGGGVRSWKELASAINQARASRSLGKMVAWRLENFDGPTDDVIENTLDQYRTWVTFRFPRFLRVIDGLQREVARQRNRPAGDYRFFAAQLETFFLPTGVFALDEYGVPVQLAAKLSPIFHQPQDVDAVLSDLRRMNVEGLSLHPAERRMLEFAREGLGE
jgi:hypothetical protein